MENEKTDFDLSGASWNQIFDMTVEQGGGAARAMILTMIMTAERTSGELYASAARLKDLLIRNESEPEDMQDFTAWCQRMETVCQDTGKVFNAVDTAIKYLNKHGHD